MSPEDLRRLFERVLGNSYRSGDHEQNGVFLPLARPVWRLGLALEPGPDLLAWVAREQLDAVFLHRPWGLTEAQRCSLTEAGIGVLAYHSAFDDQWTTGLNPALARALGWGNPAAFAYRDARPLGMVCDLPVRATFGEVTARLRAEFGGLEDVALPGVDGDDCPLTRVAVVGAMTDAFVREAHAAGVRMYVTGQWRQPARRAVQETGLGVVAIGHRRSEEWGLRALARALQAEGVNEGLPQIIVASIFPD